MKLNELEARNLAAEVEQLRDTKAFILKVLRDNTFSDTDALELIGTAVGYIDSKDYVGGEDS